MSAKLYKTLHVAKMIKVFLMNRLKIPNNTARMGMTIHKVKFAGLDLMKQNAMLLRVSEIMSPIQQPSIKIPSLGKQPNTYPAKKLQIPEIIRTLDINQRGTPGLKIIGIQIARSTKNIVQAPSSTIEARQIQRPRVMKIIPIISIAIVKPSSLSLKNVKIVDYSTSGQPTFPSLTHQQTCVMVALTVALANA